jgi:hypothetical protein
MGKNKAGLRIFGNAYKSKKPINIMGYDLFIYLGRWGRENL